MKKSTKACISYFLLFFKPYHGPTSTGKWKGLCFLGWRINQLMGFFLVLRVASSECPYGPLQPRVANRTTVYWTCVLWPAASYSCQMVWKTSTVSCYSTSRNNGWLFISLWKRLSFCFSKTVVTTISCKLKWLKDFIF